MNSEMDMMIDSMMILTKSDLKILVDANSRFADCEDSSSAVEFEFQQTLTGP
jgi:hypothetical protein